MVKRKNEDDEVYGSKNNKYGTEGSTADPLKSGITFELARQERYGLTVLQIMSFSSVYIFKLNSDQMVDIWMLV